MSTSLTFHAAGVDLTGLTFVAAPPSGLGGRLYHKGSLISASSIALSAVREDPTRGVIGNLPEGPQFAITYILKGFGEENHYSISTENYTYRVVPDRTPGIAGSLDVVLTTDGVISPNTVTITESTAGGDYIVTWGTDLSGRHSLTVAAGGFTLKEFAWFTPLSSDTEAVCWQRNDLGRVTNTLNLHASTFTGNFIFSGWHPFGAFFQEPIIDAGPPQVFGRVSPGPAVVKRTIGNPLTAPHRAGTLIFELFTSVANEQIWAEVFKKAIKVLSVDHPISQTTIIAREWDGPSESDVPGKIFSNFFSYVGTIPYLSCVR